MTTATLTSKGQITIPAEVRKALGLIAGARVDFVPTEAGSYEIVPATGTVRSLKGIIPAPKNPITIEQMNADIAAAAAEGQS
jgi:antitoxin PrlF